MATFTKKSVLAVYERVVDYAILNSANPEKSIMFIEQAAKWMYKFNQIYSDIRLDNLITNLTKQFLPSIKLSGQESNRICFIDYFGLDNRGLTQQYLRALMADSREILYILHNSNPNGNSEIIKELKRYHQSKILIIKENKKNKIDTARQILSSIENYNPKDILIHSAPWDVLTFLCIGSLDGAVCYNINLTDHAFWIGASLIDYNIEFRGMGEVISNQKRNISNEKQLSLPYYPIISKYSKFEGLPPLPDNAIKVLCGGAEYKMLGENGMFFKLMEIILNISPDVNIIVAGIQNGTRFAKEIRKIKNNNRIHLIGNRKDIAEVFRNSDIYLSSYPFFGGLMSQYAAYYAKPILIYKNGIGGGDPSEVINHLHQAVKAREGIKEFENYALNLINNPNFRRSEGQIAKAALISDSVFNNTLKNILDNHQSHFTFERKQPDYEYMVEYYLNVENNYLRNALTTLVGFFKIKTYMMLPSQYKQISLILCKKYWDKLKLAFRKRINIPS